MVRARQIVSLRIICTVNVTAGFVFDNLVSTHIMATQLSREELEEELKFLQTENTRLVALERQQCSQIGERDVQIGKLEVEIKTLTSTKESTPNPSNEPPDEGDERKKVDPVEKPPDDP